MSVDTATHTSAVMDRELAETYANWFRMLADPTRVQILSLLSSSGASMSVGTIVEQVGVGQSTVSHHLKILAEARFVEVERRSTSSFYQVNPTCLTCFPSAADVVMGRRPLVPGQVPTAALCGGGQAAEVLA
ncbi:MAG TPA: metalloregulator ArsR/SmtB family transcription factor [Acidobacteriaceae bacterium]|nr:metalloregulator ArsR/SmtB family transcription factor [Acidobacteriaceae bacterium]